MNHADEIATLARRVAALERHTTNHPDDDRLIGTGEVARMLSLHPVTVQQRIGSGPKRDARFPKPDIRDGARNRWWRSTILKYIARKEPYAERARHAQ